MATAISFPASEPELFRWTRLHFRKFLDSGFVGDPARFELLDGLIFQRPMENPPHSLACGLTQDALEAAFCATDFHVRCQNPIALADDSEPEPDLAVIRGARREYASHHPDTAELIVEVSDSTIHLDRGRRLRAYARNGIAEYWILNLVTGQLEVCRAPDRESETYQEQKILTRGDSIAPMARPDSRIAVSDLLP